MGDVADMTLPAVTFHNICGTDLSCVDLDGYVSFFFLKTQPQCRFEHMTTGLCHWLLVLSACSGDVNKSMVASMLCLF